jgi:hypothetical protein
VSLYTLTTIYDHERGLRYRGGRLVRWLEPGRHLLWLPGVGTSDERLDLAPGYLPYSPELASVLPPGVATELEVPYRAIAILRIDGLPIRTLPAGRYVLFQARSKVEATVYSTDALMTSIPEKLWHLVPGAVLTPVVVLPYERVVLYADGAQADVLGPGRYGVHGEGRAVTLVRLDLREQELQIAGQEVMTSDKVTLRVNLIVRFKIVDPKLVLAAVTNVRDALYGEAQLASRRLVAGLSLEALLEARNGAAKQMLADVAPRAASWGVEACGLDLKDIVLPGEMKTILNQVIEAEKRAAANVVSRREETAATRSLANTAKLLEQNPVLLRLKEMECLERLADRVGQVTIVATPEKLLGTLRMLE